MAQSPTQEVSDATRASAFLRNGLRAAAVALCGWWAIGSAAALAGQLDELPLDRWAKLREVERYQMNVAEKYYREKNYKVAAAEYEKFLSLYETSVVGAPYAQLKWSLCQVELRNVNTAIKDGFQSVLDYYPESPEAPAAALFIGRSHRLAGDTKKAKIAFAKVVEAYPQHLVAALTRVDLLAIAEGEQDEKTALRLLRELTFDTPRVAESASPCVTASRTLATKQFAAAVFDEGQKALATTYKDANLAAQVAALCGAAVEVMTRTPEGAPRGHSLADAAIAWFQRTAPAEAEKKALARLHWVHAAEMQIASRRVENVLKAFDEVGKRFGVDDDLLGRIGDWQIGQKNFDLARAAYEKFQSPIEGQRRVAASFRTELKWDLAIAVYNRLSGELDKPHFAAWQAEAAETLRQAGRHAEAAKVYEGLVKSDPPGASEWQWRVGSTYYHAGMWKEAIAGFRLSDRVPQNLQHMANAYRQLKQHKEAIGVYNQIMAAGENYAPWALFELSATLEESNQIEQAQKTYMQVCKRFPKTEYASRAHAHLQDKYKISVTLGGAKDE